MNPRKALLIALLPLGFQIGGCDFAQYSPPPDLTFQPIPVDLQTPPQPADLAMKPAPADLATNAPPADLANPTDGAQPVDGGTD